MSTLLMLLAVIPIALAALGLLWGMIYAALHVVYFFKALYDRMNSKEDDYYSKNIHQ